jgi:hypothetical protein
VVGIGQYMYDHPVETAMTVYAPGVMLPYRATKMTLEALGYTYNRLSRVDYKTLTTQKVFDKFEKIYKDFEELPTSVKFREGTALGVQILLDGKITDAVGKGAREVLKKASETISKIQNPAVVGVLAAASKAQQKVPVINNNLGHLSENHSVALQKIPSNTVLLGTDIDKFRKAVEHAITETKLNHFFKKEMHGFDKLLDKMGGRDTGIKKQLVEEVVKELMRSNKLPSVGEFKDVPINIAGYSISVRGFVHEGIIKIGTMFIP